MNPELRQALIALAWMYEQYCGPNFGHHYMNAGEDAIAILEKYGLGNEKDGIDHEALTELERQDG